jgi:hypothetical protein
MKASEARKVAEESKTKFSTSCLDKIYATVNKAAKSGKSVITYDVTDSNESAFIKEIIATLKNDGYKVEHQTGYDQRDRDSWNYLVINW